MNPKELTHQVTQWADSVISLEIHLRKLPALVEREHDSIRDSDIERVESVTKEKIALSDSIHEQSDIINQLSLKCCQKIIPENSELGNVWSLSERLEWMETHAPSWNSEELDVAVQRLSQVVNRTLVLQDEVLKRIRVNQRVLAKMLAQRQENYAFWQQITTDIQASYNHQGVQKSQQVARSFKAEA